MGIGAAVAHTLAERGARLVLIARSAEDLRSTLAALAGRAATRPTRSTSATRPAGASSLPGLGELHGLVCAAAVLEPDRAGRQLRAGALSRAPLDINVFGTLLAVHHCLDALRASAGAIVTFSGGGGTGPLPRFDAYAASKAAIVRLTENLAADARGVRVRVNCVAPGFVATGCTRRRSPPGPRAAGAAYYERTPP